LNLLKRIFNSRRPGTGHSLLFFSALLIAGGLQAAPVVDPTLEPLMKGTNSSEMVTVIATFNDGMHVPYLENSKRSYRDMRMGLTEVARNAQIRVYQSLMSGAESSGIPMNVTPLWVTNSMVIELPAHSVRYLQNFSEIKALIANHTMSIIQPLERANIGQATMMENDYTYGLRKLQVPELRHKFPQISGRGVVIGILDTGIEAQHPDLAGKVIAFRDFVGRRGETPYDDHGHGTHVAGTIAGGGTSGIEIGVAPEAKLIIGKVFTSQGGGTLSAILKSMDWIADPDGNPNTADAPVLVSNSWGGGPTNGRTDPLKDVFCKAVDNWVKLGIFPVFAAGNSGSGVSTVGTPGACPSAFAVGATDSEDRIASFSSRGPARWSTGNVIKPEVSAPGVDVRSAFPGGTYRVWSGTSMATPHVAGLATLIYQMAPGASVNDVAQAIINSADHLGAPGQNNDFGFGRINAFKTFNQ
jgi:subtilisin family serine protease